MKCPECGSNCIQAIAEQGNKETDEWLERMGVEVGFSKRLHICPKHLKVIAIG